MMLDIRELQKAVGVQVDGIAGPNTFSALFQRCGGGLEISRELAIAAQRWFPDYGILDSALRLSHFLAQLIHESGSFRYMEEIASGQAYEGRADLGNLQPGDGKRFKGRGPIQITGRANYRKYGRLIGIDIERHPEIAAVPSIGLHLALEYWKQTGLNRLADEDDIAAVTKRINGGTNGLAERKLHIGKIKGWLANA